MNSAEVAISAQSATAAQTCVCTTAHVLAPIILILAALVLVIVVVCLMRRPAAALLTSNAYMAPAVKFYGRGFLLVLSLAVLAGLAYVNFSGPAASDAGHGMAWVWWGATELRSILSSVCLIVGGYVVLLTILFVVLGRYREQ